MTEIEGTLIHFWSWRSMNIAQRFIRQMVAVIIIIGVLLMWLGLHQ